MKKIFNTNVALGIGILLIVIGLQQKSNIMFGGINIMLFSLACKLSHKRNGSFKKWYYIVELLLVVLGLYLIFGVDGISDAMYQNPLVFVIIPIISIIFYILTYKKRA